MENQPTTSTTTPTPAAEFLDDLDHKALVMRTHAVSVAIQLAHVADDIHIPGFIRESLDAFLAAQDRYLAVFADATTGGR